VYNSIAIKYAKWSEKFRWYYCIFAKTLKPYVSPERILDVGCGSGVLMDVLKKVFPKSDVVGIDNSKGMCGITRCIRGDAMQMPFKDKSFDLVTMFFSLHDMDIDAALSEVKRVLRTDGILAIKDVNTKMPEIFIYMLTRVLEINIGKGYADYLTKILKEFPGPKEIAEILSDGFEVKRICENIFDFDIIAELH